MYIVFNIYRVPKVHVPAFLRIQAAAAQVYKREGALDDATFVPADLGTLYGCLPLSTAIEVADDEAMLIGISTFQDRAHHNLVMVRVDADPQINALFAEVQQVLTLERVLRAVFERAA